MAGLFAALSWIATGPSMIWDLLMALWDIFWNYREEICKTAVVGAGGAVTVTLTPAILLVMGFTPAGIVAGSLAAKIMSFAAVTNTGILASLVGFCQSIGAAGWSGSAAGLAATGGGAVGWVISSICNKTVTD